MVVEQPDPLGIATADLDVTACLPLVTERIQYGIPVVSDKTWLQINDMTASEMIDRIATCRLDMKLALHTSRSLSQSQRCAAKNKMLSTLLDSGRIIRDLP